MTTKRNLMVKVVDARPADVKKALKDSGIQVVSIIEIHKEETPEQEADTPAADEEG